MNPILLATAAAVVGGAVIAVSAREGRAAVLGLGISLIAAPLLANPVPGVLGLAVRIVSALLAVYLLWVTLRETSQATRGSLLGWPVDLLTAAAAFVIGFGTPGLGAEALGPAEAQAAGFALAAMAVNPIVFGRDAYRLGIGLILLVTGATLVRTSLAGTPTPFEQLITSGLTIALGGAVAVLCANAYAASGDFEIEGRRRHGLEPLPETALPKGSRAQAPTHAAIAPEAVPDPLRPAPAGTPRPGASRSPRRPTGQSNRPSRRSPRQRPEDE